MIVRFASPEDLRRICDDLRPDDRREIFATRFDDDAQSFAADLGLALPRSQLRLTLAGDDGEPIAFIGFWLIGPGVGSANMIATPRWPSIARVAHRFCRRTVMGRVAPRAFRRLECRTLADHRGSRSWLKRLGFVEEGRLVALGSAGEDFVQCAWINPEFNPGPGGRS